VTIHKVFFIAIHNRNKPMNPIDIIVRLLKVSPKVGVFVLAGIGVFAAGAIVLSFGSNPADLTNVAIYIVIFAALVTVLAFILNDGLMRTVICWIVIGAFGGWVIGLFDAALQVSGKLPRLPCYITMPIELPEVCEARLAPAITEIGANRETRHLPGVGAGPERLWFAQVDEVLPAPPDLPDGSRVFVHVTSEIPSDTAITLTTGLAGLNWPVVDPETGGETVKEGPAQNEVRFFHVEDQENAVALAQSLHGLDPSQRVTVRDFTRLGSFTKRGLLEVWLSNGS
jgi:hypothetical protein